jgi:hypothetical protein
MAGADHIDRRAYVGVACGEGRRQTTGRGGYPHYRHSGGRRRRARRLRKPAWQRLPRRICKQTEGGGTDPLRHCAAPIPTLSRPARSYRRQSYLRQVREQFFSACGLDGNATPEVGRVAYRLALIAAAGELAIDFDVLPWPSGTAIEGVRKCFDAWRAARGGDDAVGHDAAVAVQQVRLFLERYDIKFEDLESDGNRPLIADRAGWRRRQRGVIEYLIQPEYFKTEVCKGLDPSAVARALRDRGYLRGQGRAWTITTTIPGGGKRRVYRVLESILTEQTEGDA